MLFVVHVCIWPEVMEDIVCDDDNGMDRGCYIGDQKNEYNLNKAGWISRV